MYAYIGSRILSAVSGAPPPAHYAAAYKSHTSFYLAAGMTAGGFLSRCLREGGISWISTLSFGISSEGGVDLVHGVLGGICLAYGARIAEGCTSGHGLSGMAQLSVASIVSVAAMFGSGISLSLLFNL